MESNQLIPTSKKGKVTTVSARNLYGLLGLDPKNFIRWVEKLIADLYLKEKLHYYSLKRSNKENKNARDNAKTDYEFPIRIAEAIMFMQGNEVSKQLWQQLVKQEGSFVSDDRLARLEHIIFGEQKFYKYADVINLLNNKKHGSIYRPAKNWIGDFTMIFNEKTNVDEWWVSETYASVMCLRKNIRKMLEPVKERRDAQLKLQFPEQAKIEGGSHE